MKNLIFADILKKIKVYMKKCIYSLLMMIGLIHLANGQSFLEGIQYLQNENYNAALTTFNKLAQGDPKKYIYHYFIGEVYYAMDNPGEARKAYDKGLAVSSKCDECHVGLGKLDLDANKMQEAQKHFETAIKGNSKNAQMQSIIGLAYLNNKKPMPDQAITYLSRARDLDPKQAKYWIYLGDSYQAKGDFGNAMTSYETAVEKDKNDPETYVKMGRIWVTSKQVDLAIEKLEHAIKLKPDYAIAYKDLYELYIKAGKFDLVVPILEKYVSLTGTDVDAKVRLVKFLAFQAKDYKRAIEEGNKILATNPEQYTLHRWLAWSNFETSDFQKSLDHSFQLFEEIKKDTANRKAYASDYEYAAKAAGKLTLMDTAEMFFAKLIELQPERALEVSATIAKTFYDAKKYDRAEYWYLEKAKSAELTVGELVFFGLAQKYQGKLKEADSTFAHILTLSPKYEFGWYTRAQINNAIDSNVTKPMYLAKPYYEQFIEVVSASTDPVKWNRQLIDAYLYMAVYAVQHDNNETAKSYYNLVLNLDPTNETAKEHLKILSGGGKK